MNISRLDAVRITVAYADIFRFPLTPQEARYWCAYREFSSRQPLKLPNQGNHALRQKRAQYARHKWKIAMRLAHRLGFIPTIELIGVTGALAMDNADEQDDIDFLVVTKPRALWTTRLLITLILDFFSLRRRPGDRRFANKICLNMFMSSDSLVVPVEERDLFTAHEVLQMKPLWDRGGTYQRFLHSNGWVKKFLPTAWRNRYQVSRMKYQNTQSILRFFEPLAKRIQLEYMKKRRTSEVISDTIIRFHPVDARKWIYTKLQKRLSKTNIPLDKIFYGR